MHPNSLWVPSLPCFGQISFFLCLYRICLSFSPDLDIPCSYINFIRLFLMYEKYISLRLFLSKILLQICFQDMFHQIFWIWSPSKILLLGEEDMAQERREMRPNVSNSSSTKPAFLPRYVSDLLIWLFSVLSFNQNPSGQRLSLLLCSQKHPINNNYTCFVAVF